MIVAGDTPRASHPPSPWNATSALAELLAGWHAVTAFVADDLAAWPVGLLADAGRKKLTSLVLSTEQERALRAAAA
jgi:hypothetical protein